MASCPNINLEEWKTLESAVGKLEAYRDYIETNGQIRTPEQVLQKLEARKNKPNINNSKMQLFCCNIASICRYL